MMNRIVSILLIFAAMLTGCINKEDNGHAGNGNGNLVLDFSVQGSVGVKSDATDPLDFESKVTHLDLFFFDNSTLCHYQRVYTEAGSTNKTIQGLSLNELEASDKTLKVYVVANSTKTESSLRALHTNENPFTISRLKDLVETTTYINITGFSGLDVDHPETFLMTGLATAKSQNATVPPAETDYSGIYFGGADTNQDFHIEVILVRSAAKVEVIFKKNADSPYIYAFGRPTKAGNIEFSEAELVQFPVDDIKGNYVFDQNSYYLRNLRYETKFWGGATDNMRKTDPITNSGYMTTSSNEVKVTVYIYSCSWGGTTSSVFETAPFLIVNLPMSVYDEIKDDKIMVKYLAQNFYEIPLRQITTADGTTSLASNCHYKITATVNAAGSQSSMEPYELEPVKYSVYEWNDKEINVGASESARYLSLSTSDIEMRNTKSSSEVKFSSSSDITAITVDNAYYINKYGQTVNVKDRVKASFPSNTISGNITVSTDINVENVIVYMTFTVKNKDGETKQFTCTYCPTVYIQGILSSFSYRTDFGADFSQTRRSTDGNVSAQWQNNGWTINNQRSTYTTFQSKYASSETGSNGTVRLIYYYWQQAGSWNNRYYQLVSNNTNLSHFLNPRMYHITITSTSSEYKVGLPHLDANGYTASDNDNNQLVSPSFMIASGLGSSQPLNNTTAAKQHCAQYAEAYYENGQLVKLEDWRLPTAKELEIIVKFQNGSQAMDQVITGKSYHCGNGVVATNLPGAQNENVLRCVRDVYRTPAK